jgi:hypothetical protein
MSVISPRKKAPAARRTLTAKLAAPVVDFPLSGEKVVPGHYAVRISAAAAHVDVSFDGGPWHRCRHSVGFHWFDWVCHAKGAHKIIARAVAADGSEAKGKPRSFRVI